MNPAVLTRLDQLEQEWQQRLLMQPSSSSMHRKKRRVGDPSLITLDPDPEVVRR